MHIIFYCPLSAYRNYIFTPAKLEKGVGGSESALIFLSRSLAKLGHKVLVYNSISEKTAFDDVTYCPVALYDHRTRADIFILFRFFSPELSRSQSRVGVFWSTDIPTVEPPYSLGQSLAVANAVFAISPFHGQSLVKFAKAIDIKDIEKKLWVTSCGINATDYQQNRPKIHNQMIYCSVPDRGLETLLNIWPSIKSSIKDARLVVTSDYSLWGILPNNEAFRSQAALEQGILFLGVIPRTELIRHQLESELHVHPCAIPENFCIASMECQAAGTPTVSSAIGAMPTTVLDGQSGVIVPGKPTSELFRSRFVARVVELLTDKSRLASLADYSRQRALEQFDYMKIAQQWQDKFKDLLQDS